MKLLYQGVPGAYSSLAAKTIAQQLTTPIETIQGMDTFAHVRDNINSENIAILPIENSYAGTVHANIYQFLHHHDVHVIGEYVLPIRHCLLAKSPNINILTSVYSHPQALAQTHLFCKNHGLEQYQFGDTAGAAEFVANSSQKEIGAIASSDAAKRYGLEIVKNNIQDHDSNQTRFIVVAEQKNTVHYPHHVGKFAVLFQTRDIPGALYKSLGAFATNGVDLMKIESLPAQKDPFSSMFWLEAKGSEHNKDVQSALKELAYYSSAIRVVGYY